MKNVLTALALTVTLVAFGQESNSDDYDMQIAYEGLSIKKINRSRFSRLTYNTIANADYFDSEVLENGSVVTYFVDVVDDRLSIMVERVDEITQDGFVTTFSLIKFTEKNSLN